MASPPQASSPAEIAQQQTAANQANINQDLNASNQSGPLGSLTYTSNGAGGFTANQQYSPAEQQLLTSLQGTQQTAGAAANPLLASGNYGQAPPDLASASSGLTSDLVSQATNAIIPQAGFAINNASNNAQAMGQPVGSEAYDQAMEPLYQGLGSALSGFEAQFQPQAFNEENTQYNLPLTTATSLANLGAPAPLNSSFMGSPTVQSQAANATAANQLSYNQQAQNFGGLVTGLNTGAGAIGNMLGGSGTASTGGGLGALLSGLALV